MLDYVSGVRLSLLMRSLIKPASQNEEIICIRNFNKSAGHVKNLKSVFNLYPANVVNRVS
jgi:hypothetical protein